MTPPETITADREIASGHLRSQDEVAEQLGVSRARVYQLERRARLKLMAGIVADPHVAAFFPALVEAARMNGVEGVSHGH